MTRAAKAECDVCVVGAGPVGLAVALECERRGLTVLLIESGGVRPRKDRVDLPSVAIVDSAKHGRLDQVTRRALGGNTWAWGGRCVAFDEIDFEQRSHVSYSGWPFDHREISPWYSLAAAHLGCGNDRFSLPAPPGWESLPGVTFSGVERVARRAGISPLLKDSIARAKHLRISLAETVTGIECTQSGERVAGLETRDRNGRVRRRRARTYVLACGGLETTRLLLQMQRPQSKSFGGQNGPLGRYYMGHLSGSIASIELSDPADFSILGYKRGKEGGWYRHQWKIEEDIQRQKALLNIAFWSSNTSFGDSSHRNGSISALYLGLRSPIGRLFVSPAFYRTNVASKHSGVAAHVGNILRGPLHTIAGLATIANQRWIERSLRPSLMRSANGRYLLRYHAEQSPQFDSRVSLDGRVDQDGRHRLSIDLRFARSDASSVVQAHEILDVALRSSGKGKLLFHAPEAERIDSVLDQASDGYHQIGTVRMGRSPTDSVVDDTCRVHELENLFVAGSAVFATSGQANPTLLAVALGMRLAAHLASKFGTMRGLQNEHCAGDASNSTKQGSYKDVALSTAVSF